MKKWLTPQNIKGGTMIRKGDDTNAFDFGFLTVNLKDAEEYTISKAEVRIGSLVKTFENPEFPIEISLTREETMMLSSCGGNECYMAIYDSEGRKYTCEGSLTFNASPKVV